MMGLDVSLYRYTGLKPGEPVPSDYDEEGREITVGRECIENTSAIDPEHLFKIGYFRSSYNPSGINSLLRQRLGGRDLAWIFGDQVSREYQVRPDWAQAKINCAQMIEEFSDSWEKTGNVSIVLASKNPFDDDKNLPKSEAEALDIWIKERTRTEEAKARNITPYNYSNKSGEFNMAEPMPVLAMIPGFGGFANLPCTYVVYEANADTQTWYINALKIVAETIDYVLAQDNPCEYVLHWSG